MSMVQIYAKQNIGKRSVTVDSEEDQFRDILTLMELLTNILSKDVIDFGEPGTLCEYSNAFKREIISDILVIIMCYTFS